MIDEIKSKMELAIVERLNNPLIYSFVLSWSVINYKFFMVLFSDNSVSETIRLINTVVWPDWQSMLRNNFINPMLAVCFYIFILPLPTKFVYKLRLQRANELRDIKNNIDEAQMLTVEESKALKDSSLRIELEKDKEIEALQSEISRLKELYRKSLSDPKSYVSSDISPEYAGLKHNTHPNDLVEDYMWFYSLDEIVKSEVKMTLKRLVNTNRIAFSANSDNQISDFIIYDMVSRGLIILIGLISDGAIEITEAGRKLYDYINTR